MNCISPVEFCPSISSMSLFKVFLAFLFRGILFSRFIVLNYYFSLQMRYFFYFLRIANCFIRHRYLAILLFTCSLLYSGPLYGQQHFTSGAWPVDPISIGLDPGDYAGHFRLNAQPNLSMSFVWDSEGNAVFFYGNRRGGWLNATDSIAWEFTYNIDSIRLENGVALVVVNWARRSLSGSILEGTIPIGIIRRNEPDQISPDVSGYTGSGTPRQAATSHVLGSGAGGGSWQTTTISYTFGIQSGRWPDPHYTIAVTVTIHIWVPSESSGNVEQH